MTRQKKTATSSKARPEPGKGPAPVAAKARAKPGKRPPKRGFAALSPQERQRIAGMGGRAAHASGNGRKFTSAEAVLAGRKGGQKTVGKYGTEHLRRIAALGGKAAQAAGVGHRWDAGEAKAAGARGGKRSAQKAARAKAAARRKKPGQAAEKTV